MIVSDKNHQRMLKLVGESLMRNSIIHVVSKYPPHKILIPYKGKNSNFTGEKSGQPHLRVALFIHPAFTPCLRGCKVE